jgi:hypothetical protein
VTDGEDGGGADGLWAHVPVLLVVIDKKTMGR